MVTEMDSDNNKSSFAGEIRKFTARDFLGYSLPDLDFMMANSIQWPSEYLKQL